MIVTRGISTKEYSSRRRKLAESLPDGGVAIFQAASLKYRSGPVFYEFHQDPDFFYLTGLYHLPSEGRKDEYTEILYEWIGFNEPDAVGVVGTYPFHSINRHRECQLNRLTEKLGSGGDHIFHLFVKPKDEHSEAWEGPRTGIEGAYEVFDADNV